QPRLEQLEQRQLLTVSGGLVGDTLQISISGTDTANFAVVGNNVEVRDINNALVASAAAASADGIKVNGTANNETVAFNSSFTYANLNRVDISDVDTIAFNGNDITTSGAGNSQRYYLVAGDSLAIGGSTLTATGGLMFLWSTNGSITEGATGSIVAT